MIVVCIDNEYETIRGTAFVEGIIYGRIYDAEIWGTSTHYDVAGFDPQTGKSGGESKTYTNEYCRINGSSYERWRFVTLEEWRNMQIGKIL